MSTTPPPYRKPRQITIVSPHFGRAEGAAFALIESFDQLEESPLRVVLFCALHDCRDGAALPVIHRHREAVAAMVEEWGQRVEVVGKPGGAQGYYTRETCSGRYLAVQVVHRTVLAHVAELMAVSVKTPIECASWLHEAEGEADAAIGFARRLGWRP